MLSTTPTPILVSFRSLRCRPTITTASSPQMRNPYQTGAPIKSRAVTSIAPSRPSRLRPALPSSTTPSQCLRQSSTDPTSSTPIASATDLPPSTPSPPSVSSLTWNEYLALRRSRRHYNLVSSVSTAACTTYGGLYLINSYFDQLATLTGFDPMIVTILGGVSSAGLGWLSGPILGSAVFRTFHRKVQGEMAVKEKDFFARIKKHRVDPSSQSMSNPVPDYYGEKIGSVAQFRNWMKDQRAFNKKRQTFL